MEKVKIIALIETSRVLCHDLFILPASLESTVLLGCVNRVGMNSSSAGNVSECVDCDSAKVGQWVVRSLPITLFVIINDFSNLIYLIYFFLIRYDHYKIEIAEFFDGFPIQVGKFKKGRLARLLSLELFILGVQARKLSLL